MANAHTSTRRLSITVLLLAWMVGVGCEMPRERAADTASGEASTDRPDVILILVDTLRADHLGCYGYHRETSPHLDSFAENATLFADVTAQAPWTTPSVASVLTGLYPTSHGLVTRLENGRVRSLHPSVVTLAELLRDAGYRTGAFVTNPWITPETGLDQGFDTFVMVKPRKGPRLNRAALAWLRDPGEPPTFAFVHYMDVHGPYDPPPPFDSLFAPDQRTTRRLTDDEFEVLPAYLRRDRETSLEEYVALYDGGIRYWDEMFSEFLDGLEEIGLLEDAMVIVTSDHGEEFLEHGGFNHGQTLYQEQIRVPLIWREPGEATFASTVHEPVELVDLAPTLLGLLGLEASTAQGRDLAKLLGDETREERPVFSEAAVQFGGFEHPAGTLKAVRRGDLKAITNVDTGDARFYELSVDPGELEPLLSPPPDPAAELERDLEAWMDANRKLSRHFAAADSALDAGTRAELEALGYVEGPTP